MNGHSSGAGQTVGYVRVSSTDQHLDRQLEALGQVDRLFEEKVSGGSVKGRTQLEDMIQYVRAGDTVLVASMDRLGRDVDDLKRIIDRLNAKGASVKLLKEGLSFVANGAESDVAMSRLMLHLLGGVAEFERARIRERQAEGIAVAKRKGVYQRRVALTPDQIAMARQRIAEGVTKSRVAADLEVSRQTLYDALNGRGVYKTTSGPAASGHASMSGSAPATQQKEE